MTETTTAAGTWAPWTVDPEPAFTGNGWCASDPAILVDGDLLRMFHTGIDLGDDPGKENGGLRTVICQAISRDGGRTWEYPEVPGEIPGLAIHGIPGTWEERVETAFAMKVGDEYRLYYSGYPDKGVPVNPFPSALTLATSTDGVNFTRHSDQPILAPTPGWYDNEAVFSACIVDTGEGYAMVYCGHCYTNCEKAGGVRLLGATSPDGINWTKREEPVLEAIPGLDWVAEGAGEPALLRGPDGAYYLLFTGLGTNESRMLGIARGDTPFGPWVVNPEPIVSPMPNTRADSGALAPDLIVDGDRVRMWFLMAGKDQRIATGYAEAQWPLWRG